MKKVSILILVALIGTINLQAQFISNVIEYLDINNVKAGFTVHGDMFRNPVTGQPSYEFPKGSGKHSNFVSSLWIGGIDQFSNQVKVAAQTDRQIGNDYWPGPLNEFMGAFIDSITSANWAQIWKVNKTTIDSFRQLSTHTLSNTHKSILEWPGRSANSTGGAQQVMGAVNGLLNIPNREMAPFVDVNNDNIYNPLDGDYPDIKGDQMLWWVFNDNTFSKTNSNSDAMRLEIHGSAYACNQIGLQNTIFINLRVHNWSSTLIDSVYIGLWNDTELGYGLDDYIGYDSAYKMAVTYNGDSFDENAGGYGTNLTQTGVVILGGPRIYNPDYPVNSNDKYLVLPPNHFTYYNNSNDSKTGNPITKSEYYNYLSGSWRDGTHVMSGCNPEANTGTPGNFVFQDDPSILTGVSEKNCNRTPGNRKTILSSSPFQMVPGTVPSDITFAVINTDIGVDNGDFNEIRSLADSAYKYVDGCGGTLWPLGLPNISKSKFKVYPNPSNSFFIIEDEDYKLKKINLYNSYGQIVFKTTSGQLKTSVSTGSFTKGVYFLKIDKDGEQYSQSLLIK